MADIDSPLDQQERYIAYGTGIYFIIVVGIIILTADLEESIRNWLIHSTSSDVYNDYLAIASATAISFIIGYFIKYLGLHKYTDRLFFGFQRELDGYITNSLQDYFNSKFCCPSQKIREIELLDIFFEFINRQSSSDSIQRSLYFSYYTKYGLSMNLFVLSLFGIGVILGINLFENNFSIYSSTLTYGFFITIGILAVLISQLKIRREIIDNITRRQIYRIIYDKTDPDSDPDLMEMLQNRFASTRKSYYPRKFKCSDNDKETYNEDEYKSHVNKIHQRNPYSLLQLIGIKRKDKNWWEEDHQGIVIAIGALMVISGILLIVVGTSTGVMAPMFSDIKLIIANITNSNQTNLSQTSFSITDNVDWPLQIFSGLVTVGSVLLVTGIILMKGREQGTLSAMYCPAAGSTGIAGILHLIVASNVMGFNAYQWTFFIVAGVVQIFWILPMLKRWGRTWYYIGIAGTIVLIIMWAITRIPGNPITGRGGPISEMAIAIEVLQIAFIVLTAIIATKEKNGTRTKEQSTLYKGREKPGIILDDYFIKKEE